MSHLLEIQVPFVWSTPDNEDDVINGSMNRVAFSLLDQDEDWDIEKDKQADTDLHRLEHKIDLIMQMLSQILQNKTSIPQQTLLRLGASEVSWYAPEVKAGERYAIVIHLNNRTSIPIQALVTITETESGWCHGQLQGLRPDELSAWERWVFRHHRRQIASSRK